MLKLGRSLFVKIEYIIASEHQVFLIYSEIVRFLKVEATFLYGANAFFNKSFTPASENGF